MLLTSIYRAICGAIVLAVGIPMFAEPLPFRGIHLASPKPADMPLALKFIQDALPKEGVNVLILEFNYGVKFTKRPEVADSDALSLDQVRQLADASRLAGI